MILDTTIEFNRWMNKQDYKIPFKKVTVKLLNGRIEVGYIIRETTRGIFFKSLTTFRENLMYAEWIPFMCVNI